MLTETEIQTIHARSIELAEQFADAYLSAPEQDSTYDLLDQYRDVRRQLPVTENGRFGCTQAYDATQGITQG